MKINHDVLHCDGVIFCIYINPYKRLERHYERILRITGRDCVNIQQIMAWYDMITLGGEVMVPRDSSTLAFSTELLNHIIAFATQGKSGHCIKYLTVGIVFSCLQR